MRKSADVTVVQKAIINNLLKEGKPQKVIAEKADVLKHINQKLTGKGKFSSQRCTSNRDDHILERIVK